VPDALVYEFDMYKDPAFLEDPHKRVLDLHQKAPPIFWTPCNGGHWMCLSHAANFEAAREVELFSNEAMPHDQLQGLLASMPEDQPRIPMAYPITLDPPLHAKYRMPLQRVFSPKTIKALEDSIRALARQLIAGIADKGRCEFMTAVAEPLPVQVFLKMLGLPLERMPQYRALVEAHLAEIEPNPVNAVQRLQKVAEIMRDTLLERQQEPRDDIISMLWQTEIDGRPTTLEDLENYGVLLFIAGLDTVMQGMGHGVRHLARNPELQAELRADTSLIPAATEELLRRYTFTVPPRRVAKDLTFQGVEMKKGERLMLFLPGADLDSKEYPEADKFDMHRTGPAHIAFNAGPHRCLGSHLARVELNVMYEELLAGLPQFGLDEDRPARFNGGHVIGVKELHLVWDN
jgi:cytochrome P450